MYYISEHSSYNKDDCYGTLIGTYENYVYCANSFDDVLMIYRRKIVETRNWELFWSFEISSKCHCACSNSISAAYGIIKDEIFVASYGEKSGDRESRLYLSSRHLITLVITDYKCESSNIGDLSITLCDNCCISSITNLNPENSSEISIIPWASEISSRHFSIVGRATDYVQTKILIDREAKTCTYLESAGSLVCGWNEESVIQSNVGIIEFGKALYFRDGELYLGKERGAETKLEVICDWNFQRWHYAGFYSAKNGLKCIEFEQSKTGNHQICSLYDVSINEFLNLANFTKIYSFPSTLLPSDPRSSKFVMDSRMLICSYQDKTFTYIFGMLSLKEISFITYSNFSSPLYKEYQKLLNNNDNYFGIFNERENLGRTQKEVRDLLGLSKFFLNI